MDKYRLISKTGEGTFSEVLKAQNLQDGKFRAIKCMKSHYSSKDEVKKIKEIQALRRLSPHPNIIELHEVLFDKPTGRLALVFELMQGNLYELIRDRKRHFSKKTVKSCMYQLFKALNHMHKKRIFHRDIKPENILVEKDGKKLKLADFGSCRGIFSKQPFTEYISTRWYRAPECLLTDGFYGQEMDIWGAGCVFFEMVALYPLFPGTDELDQINRIHKVLGTPPVDMLVNMNLKNEKKREFDFTPRIGIGIAQLIPRAGPDCIDLISKTIKYDLTERISAEQSLLHTYFTDFVLYPQNKKSGLKSKKSLRSMSHIKDKNRKLPGNHYSNTNLCKKHEKLEPLVSSPQLRKDDKSETVIDKWRNSILKDMKMKSKEPIESMTSLSRKNSTKKMLQKNSSHKNILPPIVIDKSQKKEIKHVTKLPALVISPPSRHKKKENSNLKTKPTIAGKHVKPPQRKRKNKLYSHVSSTGYGALGTRKTMAKSITNSFVTTRSRT